MVTKLYSVMSFVCVLIIGILLVRSLTVKYYSSQKKPFVKLFLISLIFCFIDALWGFFGLEIIKSRTAFIILSYCFHLEASFTTYYWFRFNLKFMDNKYSSRIGLKIYSDILFAGSVGVLFSNLFNNSIFFITPDCEYQTNVYRTLLFCIQYLFFVSMFIVSLVSRIVEKKPEKIKLIDTSTIYSTIPMLSGILQLVYPTAPFYSLGFMFCCLIIYIFVITSENERLIAAEQKSSAMMEYQNILQRNYSIISSLAGNYDYVCIVNTKDNTIQNLNIDGIFSDFIDKTDEFISQSCFDAMLNTIIPDDEKDEFLRNVERDSLTKRIENGERVLVEFKTSYKGKNDHYRLSVATDKDDCKNVIFGFKNMEKEYVMRQQLEKQKDLISNLEAQNEMAALLASIDGLTGLLNKMSFIERVENYIQTKTSRNCALLFFDMDHFKSINDVFGHEKGDLALKEMSLKLKSLFRSNEMIARMGGDEFCIFLPNVSYEIVEKRIDVMNEKLKAIYEDDNAVIKTSASIGCVYCKKKNVSYLQMYKMADSAMYEVKERGRDGHEIKII